MLFGKLALRCGTLIVVFFPRKSWRGENVRLCRKYPKFLPELLKQRGYAPETVARVIFLTFLNGVLILLC